MISLMTKEKCKIQKKSLFQVLHIDEKTYIFISMLGIKHETEENYRRIAPLLKPSIKKD